MHIKGYGSLVLVAAGLAFAGCGDEPDQSDGTGLPSDTATVSSNAQQPTVLVLNRRAVANLDVDGDSYSAARSAQFCDDMFDEELLAELSGSPGLAFKYSATGMDGVDASITCRWTTDDAGETEIAAKLQWGSAVTEAITHAEDSPDGGGAIVAEPGLLVRVVLDAGLVLSDPDRLLAKTQSIFDGLPRRLED